MKVLERFLLVLLTVSVISVIGNAGAFEVGNISVLTWVLNSTAGIIGAICAGVWLAVVESEEEDDH